MLYDTLSACGVLHDFYQCLRDGQFHGGAGGWVIPGIFRDASDCRMGEALFFRGLSGGDEETLLADVTENLLELLVGVFTFYEAHINGSSGFFGDYIL